MEYLPPSAIPRDLLEDSAWLISRHSVGFLRLRETTADADAELCGSGTLVQIDGTYGVLTAHHVGQCLPTTGVIGIVRADWGPKHPSYRLTIGCEALRWIPIARGSVDADGPDLGLLALPPVEVSKLKAKMSFSNLPSRRDRMLSSRPSLPEGVWYLSGFAGELTAERPAKAGFHRTKEFRGFCNPVTVESERDVGEFDYVDLGIGYGGIDQPPTSFGGYSGGGLWQVPLIRDENGRLKAREIIFSGVAFYQSELKENRRFLKCHGRRSLYGYAIDAVRKNVAP